MYAVSFLVSLSVLDVSWFQDPAAAPQDPPPSNSRREALERASRELTPAASAPPPASPFRLIDIAVNVTGAAGTSTERDAVLSDLQGGGHDPRKRGFTLQQAELSLVGAVDPYLRAEARLVAFLDPIEGETIVELEEAFGVTQSLPYGLQLKFGQYLTEFGRINTQHPHAWDFQDQPLIATRLFGPDGMRGPGARLSWLVPGDSYTELMVGAQNANGETMASFLANDEYYEERPIGGRAFAERDFTSFGDLVWTFRAHTGFDLTDSSNVQFGGSVALGPNATGNDGETVLYGIDFSWRWRPLENDKGWPFVKIEGEFLGRAFDAAGQVDENDPLDPGDDVVVDERTLRDHGFYLQGLWGFAPRWAVGLRGEWAGGSGDSYDADADTFGRDFDAFRADRLRIAPLLAFHPTEFSRFRVQYNYDDSDHLGDEVHSVWIGFDVLIGSHPPHKY
ncbi:MAG: hypothetical protein IPK26_16920 [Planctomycetes bacterium]|nr:hypothetical protein [Planctomycetota bacterium]